MSQADAATRIDEPGALPFVELSISSFSDTLNAARQLADSPSPVVRTPFGPVVHDYETARTVLRDQRFISMFSAVRAVMEADAAGADDEQSAKARPFYADSLNLADRPGRRPRPHVLATEGEDHQRLRRLVAGSFTPASADRLRPFMRRHAESLIDGIASDGGGELVGRLCRPYPIPIICELIGVDATDWKLFDHWADVILSSLDSNVEAVRAREQEIFAAQHELGAYVGDLVEQRRKGSTGDLISELIAAEDDGDRLTSDELLAMVEVLLLAGTDTTRNQLGGTLAVLADHPEQYQMLRDDPSLIPGAIEESLRYVSAVRNTMRLVTEDAVVGDLLFPAGSIVVVGLHAAGLGDRGAAARQPTAQPGGANAVAAAAADDQFGDPFTFDITAKRERPHLAFGSGIHHCLGAFLARAELQEAMAVFTERVPSYTLSAPVEWKPLSMGIWGPSRLEINVGGEPAARSGATQPPSATGQSNGAGSLAGNTNGTLNGALGGASNGSTDGAAQPPTGYSAGSRATGKLRNTQAERDQHLRSTAETRAAIARRTQHLLEPRRLPPIGRTLVTVAAVGWALAVNKLAAIRRRRQPQPDSRARLYRRLRRVAERLGPAYVKLAQLIAAGEGVFPDALVAECRRCVDQVRPEPWRRVRKVLTAELGPLHRTFKTIDEQPVAAASIAQVHRATLLCGTEVVVKVQRPGIQGKVERDVRVLAWAAPKLVGRIPIAALANPPALVELFAETIGEELDFRVEVANLIEVERSLPGGGTGAGAHRLPWRVPVPDLSNTTQRVIVMSPVDGRPLSSYRSNEMPPDRAAAVFREMAETLLEGACVHGTFHGDFHAGNVFVAPDGALGLVDFGITGRLAGARRVAFLRYVVGLLTNDVRTQLEGLAELGAFRPSTDVDALIRDLGLDREGFDPLRLTEEEFVAEFRALVQGLLTHGARIPKELMLFIKNFAYMTSVLGSIDPQMDMLASFERSARGFVDRNGLRMASEIGFTPKSSDVTEAALRQAIGVSPAEETVNWQLLRGRRREMKERLAAAPKTPARTANEAPVEPEVEKQLAATSVTGG